MRHRRRYAARQKNETGSDFLAYQRVTISVSFSLMDLVLIPGFSRR